MEQNSIQDWLSVVACVAAVVPERKTESESKLSPICPVVYSFGEGGCTKGYQKHHKAALITSSCFQQQRFGTVTLNLLHAI